ncbi:acyl-CoA desaturase [Chitinophaga caeni]|uniref:Acyl-CoA desaturase n=1 Tax=Chitinophaga caeni TaxID=2029983 RepID=A0A291QTH6_9BACT|nr:acyl-CoA desaturase [Chitinophaga caeni]ATL47182.1 acyl-CoA desaturase [Chitinophaga caeni]
MPKVSFNNKNATFFKSLKKEVDLYFSNKNIRQSGDRRLHSKTIILILTALGIYISLLFWQDIPVILGISMCGILGFTLAAIGFNVMHDACHGSYSSKNWVNQTLGLTLNTLGGNSFIWKQKHNIVHHTYTNVDGVDDDIAKSPFIRHCSTQKWNPMHRYQHLYIIFLYAISSFAWVFFFDFEKYLKKRVHTTQLQKMQFSDHLVFWFSKVMYLVFYVGLPVLLLGWKPWLIGFVAMHLVMGFTLAIVFQLAHVVEETSFEFVHEDDKVIENEWAIHQVNTTSNFAPGNAIISWWAGGLNYQVEHHLFPRISHVHYPELSKIVRMKCEEFGVKYNSMPTMFEAVRSHFRFIKELGQRPAGI